MKQAGIPATLITDSTAAFLMQQRKIDAIVVGADRIAANGDTANKIGTYGLAVAAKYHSIPFYVAAPVSTVDFNISTGNEIPIEERGREEVACFAGIPTSPVGTNVYAPAFDVTPNELIAALVTDTGVLRPPFIESLAALKTTRIDRAR
jgi:methylthioribose-1-phosphate isomerase